MRAGRDPDPDPSYQLSHPYSAAREWLNHLWESGFGRLSWQVLNEFYVNATRKFRASPRKACQLVELYAVWEPVDATRASVRRAWHWMDAARLSYWDALIVAAAERTGCGWLLSEDLQDGRKSRPSDSSRIRGSLPGFRAGYFRRPSYGLAVVVLTNLNNAPIEGLGANIAIRYAPSLRPQAAPPCPIIGTPVGVGESAGKSLSCQPNP
jgi:predicted nucleic acid-binding protein